MCLYGDHASRVVKTRLCALLFRSIKTGIYRVECFHALTVENRWRGSTYETSRTDSLGSDAIVVTESAALATNHHCSAHVAFARRWWITAHYYAWCARFGATSASAVRSSAGFKGYRLMRTFASACWSTAYDVYADTGYLWRQRWCRRCSWCTVTHTGTLDENVLPESSSSVGGQLRYCVAIGDLERFKIQDSSLIIYTYYLLIISYLLWNSRARKRKEVGMLSRE